jgi:ring-1,2-phenylacetyl-CoA epoxidase subunit PaaE
MAKFHPVKVRDIYKETKDCSVISLDIPEELRSDFAFTQGQHLIVRTHIGDEEVRRTYSLCTSPAEGQWKVAVKKIGGGLFSSYVSDTLKKGDVLEVMPPHGNFNVPINADAEKNYAAFAAGSGITPVLSIIKAHLAQEPKSSFRLFYLNRSVKSIIFKEEIEQLKNKYFGRFEIYHFLTREHRSIEIFNGRFTAEKMAEITDKLLDVPNLDDVFLCGPEEMIDVVQKGLTDAGLAKEKIHFERFFTGGSEADAQRTRQALEKKVEGTEVTIIDGGKEFHFVMDEDYDNILDGALAAGADLPYACKGGVCSTCKCRVVEGSVEMKVNYALEDREVARNVVLSCQAVPTSAKVVVDFAV